MFSIGLYELFIICIIILVFIPIKDIPKIIKFISKLWKKIIKIYKKVRKQFSDISDDILDDNNFKSWEDRVDEKRSEYYLNINNFINTKKSK